jgi:hypothetical protein
MEIEHYIHRMEDGSTYHLPSPADLQAAQDRLSALRERGMTSPVIFCWNRHIGRYDLHVFVGGARHNAEDLVDDAGRVQASNDQGQS